MDKIVLDGFSYEVEDATLWNADRGQGRDVKVLRMTDQVRGVEVEVYFGLEAFEEFRRTLGVERDIERVLRETSRVGR